MNFTNRTTLLVSTAMLSFLSLAACSSGMNGTSGSSSGSSSTGSDSGGYGSSYGTQSVPGMASVPQSHTPTHTQPQ